MNQKNLNYEIETVAKLPQEDVVHLSMNQKNLNYEIETYVNKVHEYILIFRNYESKESQL